MLQSSRRAELVEPHELPVLGEELHTVLTGFSGASSLRAAAASPCGFGASAGSARSLRCCAGAVETLGDAAGLAGALCDAGVAAGAAAV